ncbi:MAG: hypothetical protein Q8O55_00330 [Dehalococcoidales bacterium]|nr:hypothetical protein [Dehalococcoidales bacterium]
MGAVEQAAKTRDNAIEVNHSGIIFRDAVFEKRRFVTPGEIEPAGAGDVK